MFLHLTIFILFYLLSSTEVRGQNPDQYLGIPLGGVHLSQDSTSGELYAYDEYSILINHFEHHPKKGGCTSMMVGPPRLSDSGDTLVEGHGILVGLAHPLVQAPNSDFSLSQRRSKRQNRIFGGNLYRWPVVMDHLLMNPEQVKDPVSAAVIPPPARTFTGIHIRNLNNASEGKNITIKANMTVAQDSTTTPLAEIITTTTTQEPATSSTQPSFSEIRTTESSTQQPTTPESTTIQTTSPTTEEPTTFSTSSVTNPATTSTTSSVPRSSRKGIVVTASVRSNSKAVSPRLQKLSLHAQSTAKPVVVQETDKTKGFVEQVDVNDVFMPADSYNSQEGNEFERSNRGSYKLDVHYSDLDFIRKLNEEEVDFPRRAPSRNTAIQVFNTGDKPTNGHQRQQSDSDSKQTTPLFYIVDDPHAGHRERILQQLIESERSTTTTTPKPIKPLDPRFVLPEAREQLGIFLLSNGGKLTDYSGWSHNVSSYRVQLLNCNTILVPGFNFDPDEDARSSTFFVAGIGQFPDNIEKQVKINVVGERPNAALRQYKNEDILLRLPRTYRTFDIDFLSVFNTHEQKSYGHVQIPSLLVPPCSDD